MTVRPMSKDLNEKLSIVSLLKSVIFSVTVCIISWVYLNISERLL